MTTAPPFNTTLQAESLYFAYGQTPKNTPAPAVDNVSLSLHPGRVTAVVGPNGCGKSTLLKILMNHLQPQAGGVLLNKQNLNELDPSVVARAIALVPQQASVSFDYSVRHVVMMGRWPHQSGLGLASRQDLEIVDHALWTADVQHLADRPFQTLSGGERQRVTLARALAQQTPVLLLDEPTSALDLFHQLEILHHVRQLADRQNATVALVTHDLNVALRHADHAVLMDQGKVVAQGPPLEVLTPERIAAVYRVVARPISTGDGPPQLSFERQPPSPPPPPHDPG